MAVEAIRFALISEAFEQISVEVRDRSWEQNLLDLQSERYEPRLAAVGMEALEER